MFKKLWEEKTKKISIYLFRTVEASLGEYRLYDLRNIDI